VNVPVYGEGQWKVLRKYRIQLNLMRSHNSDSHNMRTFEVPGIGGIMLAPDTVEHRLFFEDRKEVFLFKDFESAVRLIKEILTLPVERALQIRRAARQRSVTSGYRYADRAGLVLGELNALLRG